MFVYPCVFESYPNLNYPSVRFLRDGVAGLVGSVSESLFHPFYNPSQTAWICKVEAQVCQLPHFPVIAASPLNKRRKKARLMWNLLMQLMCNLQLYAYMKGLFLLFFIFPPFKLRIYNNIFFFFSVIEIMMSARNFERIFFMPVYTKFSAKHLVNHCYSFSSVRLALQMQLCLSAFKKRSNWHFKLGFKKSVVTSWPF